MLHRLKIIILFFLPGSAYSQSFVYSRDYFQWPVKNKPAIVANFGELRSGHWHMGLDVRTDGKMNQPVFAAASGYISRVSVHPSGYGQEIYISHPNGLTTVYGHLNRFSPTLDSLVRAAQYGKQTWEIEITLPPNKFPVRKGQFIAYSGSTGSSQGPHVHFEIRDTKTERCINPFFFNWPIADNTPPVFTRLAVYDRNLGLYYQAPQVYIVKKVKTRYLPRDTLIKTGFSKLSFAIGAYDCVNKSTNQDGIYSARISLDGGPLVEFVLDSMDYSETEYVNAHIDYKYRYNGGPYLQQLSKLPGDFGRAYRIRNGDGVIQMKDTGVHAVRIEIADSRGNRSAMNFEIQYSDSLAALLSYAPHKSFIPGEVNVFEQNDFELYLDEQALYDSVQPAFSRLNQPIDGAVSSSFQFADASIPIHNRVKIRIKPNTPIAAESRNKIVVKRTDGRNSSYRKAEWQQEWLAASFNDFGTYQAFIDNMPPAINDVGKTDTIDLSATGDILFHPTDNSDIKTFRAELDDEWLMFTNDKGVDWVYRFDHRCPFGVHKLRVRVEDIAGNVIEKQWWFKRYPYTPPKRKVVTKKKSHSKKLVVGKNKNAARKK